MLVIIIGGNILMNFNRAFRIGALSLVAALAGANYLPENCAQKPVIVEPTPVSQTPLEKEVQRLNAINPEYALTEKDLIKLVRMVYFEDKFDDALVGDEAQKRGFAAVIEVIKNRFLYDTCSSEAPVQNYTCTRDRPVARYGANNGLIGVILKEDNGTHQFSSLSPQWYGSFFIDTSVRQGLYDASFGAQEKHQMDLAYQALVGILDGNIVSQTGGALSYKNTNVTHKLNGKTIQWHDQKVFGDTSRDCDEITKRPKKMETAQDVECRVEQDFVHDWTVKIGGHDFYTVVFGERKEFVWADTCKYNDGKYSRKESHKNYCKNP